jgi:hypothetical protein
MSNNEQNQTQSTQTAQPIQQEPIREFIQIDTSDNSRLNKGLDGGPIATKETK